jgi:phosphate transport system permease protein
MLTTDQVIRRGQLYDRVFFVVGLALTLICLGLLGVLLFNLLHEGLSRINWGFLSSFPSRKAEKAGVLSAWVGSVLVMLITAFTAIPLGVAAGVYLEEYAKKNWFTSLIEINIANLAGVPSIIYGLMALGLLVYQFKFGQSLLTGGLTLAFLILPIVIVATRESLRAIPQQMREAAFALGATRLQVIRDHLLPYSLGGTATGVIIGLSRAIGETAPLVTIGALTYIAFLPPAPFAQLDGRTAGRWNGSCPLSRCSRSRCSTGSPVRAKTLRPTRRAAGIILMIATLTMNAVAVAIRARVRRRIKW